LKELGEGGLPSYFAQSTALKAKLYEEGLRERLAKVARARSKRGSELRKLLSASVRELVDERLHR